MAKVKILSESELRKKYPAANKATILVPSEKQLWLPSRNIALNWQLGGGIPYGRIMELFGYESTGKSLLAQDFGVIAQQLGGVVLWGDIEGCFTNHWAQQNGLDPNQVELYEENDIEGFSDWALDMIRHYRSKLTKNEPILLVADSIAAFDCKDNIGASQSDKKAEMGNRAKAIYAFYRMRNQLFKKYGVCVIMVNQVRKKVGASMFEAAETNPGGDSTKFYASIRVGLNRSTQIKGYRNSKGFKEDKSKGQKVGQNVYIQIHKNKVAPPRGSIKSEVYFLEDKFGYVGYSRYHGLLDVLEEQKVVKKKGAFISYEDKNIAQGEENFYTLMHEDKELRSQLIKSSKINTISRTRKKLESIQTNLFPLTNED